MKKKTWLPYVGKLDCSTLTLLRRVQLIEIRMKKNWSTLQY